MTRYFRTRAKQTKNPSLRTTNVEISVLWTSFWVTISSPCSFLKFYRGKAHINESEQTVKLALMCSPCWSNCQVTPVPSTLHPQRPKQQIMWKQSATACKNKVIFERELTIRQQNSVLKKVTAYSIHNFFIKCIFKNFFEDLPMHGFQILFVPKITSNFIFCESILIGLIYLLFLYSISF